MKTTSTLQTAAAVSRGPARSLCTIAIGLLLLAGPQLARSTPVTSPPRVLILDETTIGGASSLEALAAVAAIPGCAVDIATAAQWGSIPGTGLGGPTGYGFDSYRAIILGDPYCNTSTSGYLAALTALNATKTVWTPAVTGNVILEGVDNAYHYSGQVGAAKSLDRGIAFAVNDPTKTGLYYALSCYYQYTAPAVTPTLVPHLTGFGTFMTRTYANCFNDAHIVATHAVFTAAPALTDFELSNWSCSTHEGFDAWPANFVVLAIALTNGVFTATDGSNGVPYILVRGEGVHVLSNIHLDPPLATNNLGTTHTVCATLATNVFPKLGVAVTFTILSGPNSVTNFTTLTDVNGVACFTYTGMGGPGVDYITASYTVPSSTGGEGIKYTSETVAKIWVNHCLAIDCENIECLADATWSYKFCVTNLTSGFLSGITLQNPPAGIVFNPSVILFNPPLSPGQVTNLTVGIASSSGPVHFCFNVGSIAEGAGTTGCSTPHCVTLPTCCNRVVTNTLTYAFTSGLTTTYNYQLTFQNIGTDPLKYVGFAADQSCVSFLPPLVNLTLPAYGGPSLLLPTQTRTITVQVQKTAPCPGTNNIYLSTFTSNLIACCSTKLALPKAKCLGIGTPYDGSVFLTNTPIFFKAVSIALPFNPCGFGPVSFYNGTTLLGVAPAPDYSLTLNELPAGNYSITAVSQLSSEEVETSDPVNITILAPGANDQHSHAGTLFAGVSGTTVVLTIPTDLSHDYLIQFRDKLNAGDWAPLKTIHGDGSTMIVTDTTTNSNSRYYRFVQMP